MQNTALLTAGIIFTLVAIMHLLRLLFGVKVKVGNFTVPQWFSILGFIVPLLLAIWMFKAR